MKNIAKKELLQIHKKKLSKEETKYGKAKGLMEAISCVYRFEKEVEILRVAAATFEELGDYKDSAFLKVQCEELAEEADKKGSAAAYKQAVQVHESARTKMDYRDAISELNRIKEYEEYSQDCQKRIAQCKEALIKIEDRAVWKRRGIALLAMAVLVILVMQTPAYPWAKGMVHYQQKNYEAALGNFKEANGFITSNGKAKACSYNLAKMALEQGQRKKAMIYFRGAENYKDAENLLLKMEQEGILSREVGDSVFLAGEYWILLEKTEDKALVIRRDVSVKRAYDKDGNSIYEESTIYKWLNTTHCQGKFNAVECEALIPLNVLAIEDAEKREAQIQEKARKEGKTESQIQKITVDKPMANRVFLLTQEEYEKYRDLIPQTDSSWWLQSVDIAGMAKYVGVDGNVYQAKTTVDTMRARPAVWISLK